MAWQVPVRRSGGCNKLLTHFGANQKLLRSIRLISSELEQPTDAVTVGVDDDLDPFGVGLTGNSLLDFVICKQQHPVNTDFYLRNKRYA
ncbi:unnamed protein product [Phytophthora fragariaefolia]|uniref:Unnamed protein product n=1 Tax=Phytophthora fragariaefolia TaxID=1490495 RepID=A0A9W6YN24_9STRA|nr:unnamed protein product [Phytophthora fragariaefolia]